MPYISKQRANGSSRNVPTVRAVGVAERTNFIVDGPNGSSYGKAFTMRGLSASLGQWLHFAHDLLTHGTECVFSGKLIARCADVSGDRQMQITNAMTPSPVTIRSDEALAKAKALMEAGGFRRLPVVEDGHLVGILTERDLRAYTRLS
jgi:hypothetical protein